MRSGRKKSDPLMRRADPEYQSWTIHDRPQNRENYQDGDRSLSNLWRDRPYQDVEQPHMDADPDIDAEESGEPVKRLNMENVVRKAVIELAAESSDDSDDSYKTKHLDMSGAFDGPLWPEVAPVMSRILDLMRANDTSEQLRTRIKSSSISRKKLLLYMVDISEKFGFGYRTDGRKTFELFKQLVPAVTGLLANNHNRGLLKETLGQWVSENGEIPDISFVGAPDDLGFTLFTPTSTSPDAQEFYEGYIPGAVPRQETFNLKRIVALANGQWSGLVDEISDRLKGKMIVDFSTALVNTKRLQSMLRYVTEQPDAQLAMAIVVGTVVREVARIAGAGGEDTIKFADGHVSLNITVSQLLGDMQGGTRRIVDEWLSMAVSMMRVVGVVPGDKPNEDEEDAEYLKADMSKYQRLRDRMRDNLVKIALKVATSAFQGLYDSSDGTAKEPGEVRVQPDKKVLRRPVIVLAEDVDDRAPQAEALVELFDKELKNNRPAAAALAAQELYTIASGLGASPDNLSAVVQVINELKAMAANKAASMTVADIAKRIIAPAKVRVVTQDEVEDGIELGDGETLELPGKCHAARLFGG